MFRTVFWSLLLLSVMGLIGCKGQKSDEERIREEIDSASVHMTIGLKLLMTNPENDPEIAKALDTLHAIMDAVEAREKLTTESQNFTLSELGQIAKVAYSTKQLGAVEVAKGRQSDFRFLVPLFANDKNPDDVPLTVEQDHALTLVGMFVSQLYPLAPIPITEKALLYEAWMAGDAEFGNDYLDLLIRGLQATIFAKNDYCDLALHHTELLKDYGLEGVDKEALEMSLASLLGVGRAVAHAPESAVFLIPIAMLPMAIEIFPGVVRIMAHVDTAGCFEGRDENVKAMKQRQHAIDAIGDMGVPEADIALLRAILAHKNKDPEAAADYLRKTQESKLLDDRTKKDLMVLADNIDNPDKSLVERYFSSAAITLAMSKIINQRLKDEGFYDKLYEMEGVNRARRVFSSLMSADISDTVDDAMDTGKGLLDTLKKWLGDLF